MSNSIMKVAEKIDQIVLDVTSKEDLEVFQKAFVVAEAVEQLKAALTPQYMAPIMNLQGSALGFKTDKPYPESKVKECLIEAVLGGLKPYGNEFNIIGGNTYVTSEGLDSKLEQIKGLRYMIQLGLPRINQAGIGAATDATISWTYQGEKHEETISIPVRINKGQGVDAIAGKTKRKAKKWLFETIKGTRIPDGDVEDVDFVELRPSTKSIEQQQKQQAYQDLVEFIECAETLETLAECEEEVDEHGLRDLYQMRVEKLSNDQK